MGNYLMAKEADTHNELKKEERRKNVFALGGRKEQRKTEFKRDMHEDRIMSVDISSLPNIKNATLADMRKFLQDVRTTSISILLYDFATVGFID